MPGPQLFPGGFEVSTPQKLSATQCPEVLFASRSVLSLALNAIATPSQMKRPMFLVKELHRTVGADKQLAILSLHELAAVQTMAVVPDIPAPRPGISGPMAGRRLARNRRVAGLIGKTY